MNRRECLIAIAGLLTAPFAAADAQRWTPASISSELYESSPTFTPDGREMYFFRADKSFSTYWLLMSRCANGAWTKPVAPPFAAGEKILEADPFVTPDGKRLYFVSARATPAGSEPDLDVFYVERQPDGKWSEAHRLPEPVSSPGPELLPRALRDGRLVFGSNRPDGLGDRDIYIATPHPNGTWSVKNFGPPVNTAASEYEAEISQSGDTLVLVANRGERSHLYRFALQGDRWVEIGRVPARSEVFQVGPLLSPTGDRVLFAQAIPEASGEIFLLDLKPNPDRRWPPECGKRSLQRETGPD